jgi:hypothetical protein
VKKELTQWTHPPATQGGEKQARGSALRHRDWWCMGLAISVKVHTCVSVERLMARVLLHPVLEGKPNANHVRARIRNSRNVRLHNWTSSHIAQSK